VHSRVVSRGHWEAAIDASWVPLTSGAGLLAFDLIKVEASLGTSRLGIAPGQKDNPPLLCHVKIVDEGG